MKTICKIAAAALALTLTASLIGCSSKRELRETGKFTVATNAEFEPFEYMDNNKIVGIDVDISNEIAKNLNATLKINNMEFNSVVTSVAAGKADAGVAGITKTDERAKAVDFSDPYYDASQVIIVKKSDNAVTGQDSLKGKKIAVQKGTTGDDLATKITGDSNVERFSASTDAVTELKNGKVAAVIIDSFPAATFVKQNSTALKIAGKPLSSEKYCIVVHKGNKALLDSVNKTIKSLKNSGKLDSIIKKYS